MITPEPAASTFIAGPDPAWPEQAAALIRRLRAALGPAARRVEHIGSTAIPGMAAKPLLDLQVSVADLDAAAAAFDVPLAALGFTRRPFEQDHVPAGHDDPPHRWAKRYWNRRVPGEQQVNLHCRLVGSPNERLALLFRDWFRAHPEAVPAYARFKEVLAAAVGDPVVYTEVKDPVVDLVVAVAEEWATATGWSPDRV
ncbi:GrpB family protein [Dactylosporangium sp. NPDC051541]|uniref:GrpB family protein n=1 Tax=Dactylosporangium sp. NPDC051541 TaxID=3363977 RepID=UPI0037B6E3B8